MNTRDNILMILENRGKMRPVDLMEKLGVSQVTIQKQLKRLVEEGKVEKNGRPPEVWYQIGEREKLPRHIRKLLWDVNLRKVNLRRDARFIIERVMEFGLIEDIKWMNGFYQKNDFRNVLATSRRLSPKTVNFWVEIYGLPRGVLMRGVRAHNRAERFN